MAHHVYSEAAIKYEQYISRDSNQMLLNDSNQQVLIVNCAAWTKFAIYDCLAPFAIDLPSTPALEYQSSAGVLKGYSPRKTGLRHGPHTQYWLHS